MNDCHLQITRKFLLSSQVQGNMNLTEEGKDVWNSFGFKLTCTDPGAILFVIISMANIQLIQSSRF